ncbi:MAG: polysaccharide biosynthesis protein, partial [Methylicorpusculum sp.]|nr:polysaccharide biosynthesis protein [Methylicorpusculum sp.]
TVFGVQTIYHAAAYKHVPMVEKNPGEAVLNNVFGTLSLAKAAIQCKVETFVLISTDKAVRPTNTMGATKRFAELILQALSVDHVDKHKTRFTMVRFGNVLGSSGSVVPLFREQIARGGPVTVTDSRIIRYFMTIPEASQLVIQAGALGRGGDVFVLDMGEPVRILDLARRMIHLSGLTEKNNIQPSGDIEIVFTGLRPGEKLYEELLIGENVSETTHPRIMRAQEEIVPWKILNQKLQELEKATLSDDYMQVRKIFKEVVSGFAPQCSIEDWIWTESTAKLSGIKELKIRKLNQIN